MFIWSKSDKVVIPVAILIIVAAAACLHFLLRNRTDYFKRFPLQIISAFIIAIEIAKQIYFGAFGQFDYYALPVHFCSLIAVLTFLAQFLPKKAADIFKPMAFVYSLMVFLLVLVNPRALIGNSTADILGNFHNIHTFCFHFSVIAYFIFSVALYDYEPKLKHCINLACGVAFYACYAVPVAFKLNVNYVNIIHSDFEPLEKFRLAAGQVWYDILLFSVAVAGACLLLVALYFIYKLFNKLTKNKKYYYSPRFQ